MKPRLLKSGPLDFNNGDRLAEIEKSRVSSVASEG